MDGMSIISRPTVPTALRLAASAVAAVSLVGVFIHGAGEPDPQVSLAGSGHSASPVPYVPPTVGAMNMGVTATTTTPGASPAIAKAVPAKLAGQ